MGFKGCACYELFTTILICTGPQLKLAQTRLETRSKRPQQVVVYAVLVQIFL